MSRLIYVHTRLQAARIWSIRWFIMTHSYDGIDKLLSTRLENARFGESLAQ